MDEDKHRAVVRISHEFLRDILFPKGAKVLALAVDVQDVFGREDFVCVVEHPDLPPTKPGQKLPEAMPQYRRINHGDDQELDQVVFVDWGVEEHA